MQEFKSDAEAIDSLKDAYTRLDKEIGKVVIGQRFPMNRAVIP